MGKLWLASVLVLAFGLLWVSGKTFLENPIKFPLHVNVVFLGFSRDGPFNYKLSGEKVHRSLTTAFSEYTPYSLESKSPLNIKYSIDYTISFSNDISKYEAYLRNALYERDAGDMVSHSADIPSVEAFFEKQQSSNGPGNYTLYFVHPNKDQLIGRFGNLNYSYSLNKWGNAQSWIGSGRYAVIDMTAGPVRYGKMAGYGEGAVDYESFPRIIEFFLPEGYQGTSLQGASPIEIEAHISSLIISATKYLFATDLHSDTIPYAEKLLIPVIVLRNHNEFNPFEQGINMEIIRHEALRMALPGQTIQIVSANHYVHEHPHISISLSKSFRTDTSVEFNELGQYRPQYRPYVDSNILAHQLRQVSDILGQGLLGSNPYASDLKSIFFNENLPPNRAAGKRKSLGTRVLPIYVFSLARYDPKLLLDKYHQVAAFNDMVVVLQTNATAVAVPFFSGSSPIFVDPKDVTKSIVAGLASSLGSITPPTTRFSGLHNAEKSDYIWAQGQHPFGHFTNSSKLSQVFIDCVTRNTIIAKVHNSVDNLKTSLEAVRRFAKKYFIDPLEGDNSESHLALVSRIENGIDNFNIQFSHVSKLLDASKMKEAYTTASALEVGTAKFFDYTMKEIEIADNDLICCIVQHQFQSYGLNIVLWACMVAASVFIVITCFKALRGQWSFLR